MTDVTAFLAKLSLAFCEINFKWTVLNDLSLEVSVIISCLELRLLHLVTHIFMA